MTVLGALVAAAASLLKAIRLPVLVSAQPQAWQQAQRRWLKWQSAAALAVFVAAALFLWFGDCLIAGFAVLAALLLGAALLLPLRSSNACSRSASAGATLPLPNGSGPTAASNCPGCRWR